MNITKETDLRERLRAAMNVGLTEKAAAIELGSDEQSLTAWLQGRADDTLAAQVNTWCEQVDRELAESLPGFIETPTWRRIQKALHAARQAPEVITIFGEPGCGKTSAIDAFIRDQDGFREQWAYYIEAQDGTTASRLLHQLCKAVNGHYDIWARHTLPDRIADNLTRGGFERGVIFVDEVQRLENRQIAGLAWFYNQRGISLVLCGNVHMHSDFHNGKKKELAALSDRSAYRLHLTGPSADDVDAILAGWNVKGRTERAFMQKVRERTNSLRPLLKILRPAAGYARMRNVAIDIRMLRSAAVDLGFAFEG